MVTMRGGDRNMFGELCRARVVTSVLLTKKLGEVVHGWGFYIGTAGTYRVYTTPAVVRV